MRLPRLCADRFYDFRKKRTVFARNQHAAWHERDQLAANERAQRGAGFHGVGSRVGHARGAAFFIGPHSRMNKTTAAAPVARTWQDISQSVNPRAMSKAGRRRRLAATLKLAGVLSVLAAVAWGAIEISNTIGNSPNKLGVAESGPPLQGIVLTTDGVLDHTWAGRTLALPKNASLMSLDLYALRTRLLATGQIKAAVLTRNFPATLVINIQERSPVARVQVQVGDAPPRALLVARDGVV